MDKPLNVDADNSMINKTGDRYMFKFFHLTIKLFKYKSAAFLSVNDEQSQLLFLKQLTFHPE